VALDTLYTAETPEGIALSLRPAGIVPRSIAYAIDFGIRMGIFFIVVMIAGAAGGLGAAVVLITFFALEWFYPVIFELSLSGATPGKRIMGLQVVMDSGLPVTPAASVVRNLLRAADFLPMLYAFGGLSMLLQPHFKRLGDMAAGTLVVYSEAVVLHGAVPDAQAVAPARPLQPREQAAVVSWAGRAARLTPDRLEELAELARPLIADRAPAGAPVTPRLLGVAQWVMGRREAPPR
jgi:uncharacterized RDD family membrane protein YckC